MFLYLFLYFFEIKHRDEALILFFYSFVLKGWWRV